MTHRHAALVLLGTVLVAPCMTAQTRIAALPRVLSGAFASLDSGFDKTNKETWYQFWYHGVNLPTGSEIREISVRPDDQKSSPGYTYTYSMTMSNTTADAAGLSRTLAKNHGAKKVVVVPLRIQTCAASSAGGSPDRGQCWVKLKTPFKFTGPHLLIETYVKSVVTPRPTKNDFFKMTGNSYHASSGTSCGGASLSASYANGRYAMLVKSAQPKDPIVFLFGVENVSGPIGLLPYKLGGIGMPGCKLGLNPVVAAQAVADSRGEARLVVPYQPGPGTATVFVQAVHPTKRNAAGRATTNTIHSVVGKSGLCDTIVSSDGKTANAGFPFRTNGAPVFLWR